VLFFILFQLMIQGMRFPEKKSWFIVGMLMVVISFVYIQLRWNSARNDWQYALSLPPNENINKVNEFRRLEYTLSHNAFFLKDYAEILLTIGDTKGVFALIETYGRYFNQYDKKMLVGECLSEQSKFDQAITYFKEAAVMVPNRFQPFYNLMRLSLIMRDSASAIHYARTILDKPVKVPSSRIDYFRKEARGVIHAMLR
jgi:tetratricopeptide (TPR) repeat protein